MTSITTIQETPGLRASSIVFTTGSSIQIEAPAERVFEIICNGSEYDKWCSWTPRLIFGSGDRSEGVVEDNIYANLQAGTKGELTCWMEAQKKEYKIPITIAEFARTPSRNCLAWRAALLPSWFAIAERVQLVTSIGDESTSRCEIRQWESTSGWGAYLLKYLMGVEAQLREANLQYVRELKAWAEQAL